jgi:nuclear pore complex protein Nup107
MECMDLSALIAAEDSDLLELFMKVGRMQELVEAFAYTGKSLLLITAAKGSSSKSKKIRTRGWTPELWTVKS